jgi:hypothetical protein
VDVTKFTADQLTSGLGARALADFERAERNAAAVAEYFGKVDDAPKVVTGLLAGALMLSKPELDRHFALGDILRHNSPSPLGQDELIKLVFACEVRPCSIRARAWRIFVAECTALGHTGDG